MCVFCLVQVSWESHIFGLLVGVAYGFVDAIIAERKQHSEALHATADPERESLMGSQGQKKSFIV